MSINFRAPWGRLPKHFKPGHGILARGATSPMLPDAARPPRRRIRAKAGALMAALALTAGLGLVVPGTASAASFCGITWGSLAKSTVTPALGPSQDPITNIRSGRHACFDRLVVDLNGEAPRYTVRYVGSVAHQGSGLALPLRGGAFLDVKVMAPAHDQNYIPTYTPANRNEAVNVAGYQSFRQVAFAGTYESVTQLGLGVRARLPFRVFTLPTPGDGSRLVIDVAHRW